MVDYELKWNTIYDRERLEHTNWELFWRQFQERTPFKTRPATSSARFSWIQFGVEAGTRKTPVQYQKHVNQCATKIMPTPVLVIATTIVTHCRPAAAALSSIMVFNLDSLMSRIRRRTLRMRAERSTARLVSPKLKETKL